MILRYIDSNGKLVDVELGPKMITIGRARQCDIVVPDAKVSRQHCVVRYWDGEFVVKDLKSRNGTFVNEHKIEVAALHSGDTLRVGTLMFRVERQSSKGTRTILREVSGEMDKGKGYRTILREIVDSTEKK